MSHHQTHQDSVEIKRAFIIGICLNASFVILELIAGFYANSLSLLSDAFHNVSDVAALALSMFAFKLSFKKSTEKFTYGYKKSTILVPILNATMLLIITGGIGYAAIMRLETPKTVNGLPVIIVAFVGIIINSLSAFFFLKEKDKDLNIKGSFIHLAADALIALGVVFTGIIIYYTKLYWLDSVVSIAIILVVIINTYSVLRDGVRMSLDAVPSDISVSEIREKMLKIAGIEDIHDLHIWPMSTTETALTVHVVVEGNQDMNLTGNIKTQINNMLKQDHIFHTTIDFEQKDSPCGQPEC